MSRRSERCMAMQAKEVSYFTGRPCKHGHISKRWTVNAKCMDCHYLENPKKNIAPFVNKKELQAERSKKWYVKNRERAIKNAKEWKNANPEKVNASWKKWRMKETSKLITFMRDSLRRLIISKTDRTSKMLGYSPSDLKLHIEGLFSEGMSWDNYGEWHIDRIIPLSWFVWAGVNDPKVVNKLTNLQPLWAKENASKWRPKCG